MLKKRFFCVLRALGFVRFAFRFAATYTDDRSRDLPVLYAKNQLEYNIRYWQYWPIADNSVLFRNRFFQKKKKINLEIKFYNVILCISTFVWDCFDSTYVRFCTRPRTAAVAESTRLVFVNVLPSHAVTWFLFVSSLVSRCVRNSGNNVERCCHCGPSETSLPVGAPQCAYSV